MQKKIRAHAEDLIGDLLKRLPVTAVGELKLPKDMRSLIQGNLDRWLSNALSRLDVNRVLEDLLSDYRIKISAELTFEPKKGKKKRK
jgi:hypothetical protein